MENSEGIGGYRHANYGDYNIRSTHPAALPSTCETAAVRGEMSVFHGMLHLLQIFI